MKPCAPPAENLATGHGPGGAAATSLQLATENAPADERILIRHMRLARDVFAVCFVLHALLSAAVLFTFFRDLLASYASGNLQWDWILNYGWVLGLPIATTALCFFLLFCTLREYWELTTDSLTRFGLYRRTRVRFSEVISLRWMPFNRMILLRGPEGYVPLFLDSLSPPLRRIVIERIHAAVPLEKQISWPRFERRLLVPLRDRLAREQPNSPLPSENG